jgi:hypothetical protein
MAVSNGIRIGPRVAIPAGFSCLSDAVRAGIVQERAGSRMEALKQSGLAPHCYLAARDIVLLSQRTDLSDQDMKVVQTALQDLDSTCTYGHAVRMVKPIARKVWGRKGNRFKADKSRLEALSHTISYIQTISDGTIELNIPTMTKEQRKALLIELNDAISSLHHFYQRVKNGE